MRRRFIALFLFVMMIGAGAGLFLASRSERSSAAVPQHATRTSPVSIPLFFEPNQGQTDPRVKFLARGSGYGIFLTADEAVLKLQPGTQYSALGTQQPASVIRMRLDGANSDASISGSNQLPGKSNYFIGNDPSQWHRGIPQFGRVEYKAVYPGIDLVYYGRQGHLEYDFHIAPSADPNQIALNFDGAAAHIDAGDLVLSTERGELRFHAPHVYQNSNGTQKDVAGSFRQIAENKIGFSIGAYDRSRELVIDPELSYSTYLGGSGAEGSCSPQQSTQQNNCPKISVAVGADNNIYVSGSTESSDFPTTTGKTRTGTQNIFLAVINPSLAGTSQLVFATYLGGSGIDTAAGVGVTPHIDSGTTGYDIYVAGSTTSTDFPTSSSAFEGKLPTNDGKTHSFVSRLNVAGDQLSYSTYLAGNTGGNDTVTGLAVDSTGNAFVTGTTTSTDSATGFPSTTNAFQPCPWQPLSAGTTCTAVPNGPTQFFISKINTAGTGSGSMLYSTYFGGGYIAGSPEVAVGGGIAVDTSGNIYFTGGTNMPGVDGPNPTDHRFPVFSAQQTCLNDPGGIVSPCPTPAGNPAASDAFVAKINPNISQQPPVFSTLLGGSGDDVGLGVAVDGSGNAYVTGSTTSTDWSPSPLTPIQASNAGGQDGFLAKVANPGSSGAIGSIIYFTYLGGSGTDTGQGIVVDANQSAHIVGTTASDNLPLVNQLVPMPLPSAPKTEAFVALISTTFPFDTANNNAGDYVTYLGGSGGDQGESIALDLNNATYVSGVTSSTDFPMATPPNPYQATLNNGGPDAFISELGPKSVLSLSAATNSPSPNPVAAGNQVAFTFNIKNVGPDTATTVVFVATFPATGLTSQSAKITTGGIGSCGPVVAGTVKSTITCTINSLSVAGSSTTGAGLGTVEVDLTPTVPVVNASFNISGAVVSANGQAIQSVSVAQPPVNVTDFSVSATPPQATVTAGQNTSYTVALTPGTLGYTATVSMTDSGLPTNSTATYTTTPVTLSGTGQATTILNVSTQPEPVTTGSLFRGHMLYATWLPVGGLSLLGLGVGASRKRRLWLAGALLGLLAGILLLQPGCGSTHAAQNNGGTPPGTYTLTITATSGAVSHNTTVLLVVNAN